MAVEQRLRRGLTEAAEHLSIPPATADGVIGRGRWRRTQHLAGYSLVAVVALMAVTLGALQLAGVGSPGLQVAGGPGGPQGVAVFLCDGSECDAITSAQREELRAALEADPATVSVTFESKQDAYARFSDQFADQPDFLDGVTAEQLPASFRVLVAADVNTEAFAARYQTRPGVHSAVVLDNSQDDGAETPQVPAGHDE